MAIARREFDAGITPAQEILDGYAEFLGQDNVYRSGLDAAERIDALNRDLAQAIRDGDYDDELLGTVHDLLTNQATARLRLSQSEVPRNGGIRPTQFELSGRLFPLENHPTLSSRIATISGW